MSRIPDIFRQHGITVAITAPLLQIQELAFAVTLLGSCRVSAAYRGLDHLVEVCIYERCGRLGTTRRTMAAALPTRDSDRRQHEIATSDMEGIIEVLEELLAEDPA